MRDRTNVHPLPLTMGLALLFGLAAWPSPAQAGKLSWLDDVVRRVVREAEVGAEAGARSAAHSEGRLARSTGRLLMHEADEGLEAVARRSDDLARAARRVEEPAEALLETRFTRLTRPDPELSRTFKALRPVEKRLVVEMGETAQDLARRYPGQAEGMIRKLGVEGMTAVRVFDDVGNVAEVVAKEGPESIDVLRKTGRGGWRFYTEQVLRHKKKLAAAGVLALFLANPDKFVDTTGQITEYAVQQFSRAGLRLAGAVGSGASKGLEASIGEALAAHGLDSSSLRHLMMGLTAAVVFLAAMVLLGLPIAWIFRPITWPIRLLLRRRRAA